MDHSGENSDNSTVRYGFGPHLMVEGYGCSKESLTDINKIYSLLDNLPGLVGMTKIMPPYVFRCDAKIPEDWGLSGFVLIAESHISIHTFPEKEYLTFDLFSCRAFDHKKTIGYLKEQFDIQKVEQKLLKRGVEFPHYASRESLETAKRLALEERLESTA